MKKRLVALIMVMALALSLVPVGAVESVSAAGGSGDPNTQIVDAGGTVYYDKNGKLVQTDGLGKGGSVVEMSKTVETTGTENEFEVTLNVKTNQNLTELSSANPDAAVVLVLDVSGSMDWCVYCGNKEDSAAHTGSVETIYYCKNSPGNIFKSSWNGKCVYCGDSRREHKKVNVQTEPTCTQYESRLEAAQKAACDFLDKFATLTAGEGKPAHRWVKVIEFESSARTVNENWIDVSTQNGLVSAKAHVNSLEADGGTNIEAGLQLARNNLYQRSNPYSSIYNVDYLYTILLTDGKPTYGTNNESSTSTSSIGSEGDSGNTTNYSDVNDVTTFANNIKGITSTSKLYSICFGTDSDGDEVWKDELLDDDSGAPSWGFDKNITVEEWLQSWSSGAYSGGATGSDLFDNFQSIMTQISLSTKAFIVRDTMGQCMTSAEIQPVKNDNGTVYNDAKVSDNTLTWRILSSEEDGTSTYDKNDDGTITGYLSYTLKYTVTLDNLTEKDVISSTNVNQDATLTYAVQEKDGTWDGDVKTGTFAVPKVKSHYGNLTFTKKGSDGKTLENVTFTLTTADKDGWSMPATSNRDGTVSFTNIPSGHTYTLTEVEITTPEGYVTASPITVQVSDGAVTTSADTNNSTLDGGTLVNQAEAVTETDWKAGYFIITPNWIPEDFDPAKGYDPSIYMPNAEGDTVEYKSDPNHKVDATTGYIGYLTEAGHAAWDDGKDENGRFQISEDQYDDYLIRPTDLGTIDEKYGEGLNNDTYELVWYQINNHSLSSSWPDVASDSQDVTQENSFHVDGYIKNVTVQVRYYPNGGTGSAVIDENLITGNSYSIRGNDGNNATNFTRTGYTFTGWNTRADGTGTAYAADQVINPLMSDMVLYAQWEANTPTITVSKDANSDTFDVGDTVTYTVEIGADPENNEGLLKRFSITDEKLPTDDRDVTIQIKAGDELSAPTYAEGGNPTISEGALTFTLANPLDADETVVVTYDYTIQQNDVKDGKVQNTATVKVWNDDPEKSGAGEDTETITQATYGLTVDKTVTGMTGQAVDNNKMAKPGDTLTYTITVTNIGNTTRENVVLTDTFKVGDAAGGLTFPANPEGYRVTNNVDGTYTIIIDSLEASDGKDGGDDTITITATYTVTDADAGKTITNTAVALVDDENPDNNPKDETTTTVENPDWTVIKTAAVGDTQLGEDDTVNIGDTITYTITVTNTGNTTLNGLTVTDTMDDGRTVTWETNLPTGVAHIEGTNDLSISELEPGASVEITATYDVVDADAGQTFKNTVTVSDGATTEKPTTPPSVTVNKPGISITKTASVNGQPLESGDAVDIGDTITYTLTVTNTGETTLTSVTVRDNMWGTGKVETIQVEGVEYPLGVAGGYWKPVQSNGPVGTVEALPPGETWTCTYTYTVQDGDTTIENTATVSTTEDGPGDDDTITIPVTGYNLSIDKVLTSVNGDPYQEGSKVRPGDVLTYTINVTNNNAETVTSFTVKDNLWEKNQVETITIGTATADVTVGSYLFRGTLYQGDTWTCTYNYTVPEDAASVSNTAVIDLPGENDPNDTVTVEVEPDAPSLQVEKTLTQVNGNPYTAGSSVSVGDTLTYTIKVTNTGNVNLTNVTVTDTFNGVGDLTFSGNYTAIENDDGTYTINLGDLKANDTVTITATYKVLRADASSDLTNGVTVSAGNPGGGDTPITDEDKTPETPVNPYYPPVRPVDPPALNTEDHYAYIVGYEDGTVRPEGNITRAEVATIFFRLLTDESRDEFWSQTNPYSDVAASAWYNNAVSTLTNAGIIDGYEDGTFRPNGNITRAEFATIASRFFEATYDGADLFPDIDGHWAADYINEAANAGIVNGYEDGTFRPQKNITRAEAVTMVNRTIDRHPDAEHLLDDMIVWPDNPETAWYYEQIQEATNSHEYTMHTDAEKNPYEVWTELLPVRDWAQLEKEWSDAHSGQSGGEVV